MTGEQAGLFGLFAIVFALLVWGRIRYDLVAFSALVVAVLAGYVPDEAAFSGFGHPAVIIIALVLVVSRGLTNSGAVEWAGAALLSAERPTAAHIGVMSAAGALLSAVINNVAALALLMPLDVEAAEKAKRAVSRSLMPLSFATILGGMITLIGTPPNIVIAQYREDVLGTPFAMFDFAPVGGATALAGIAFVTIVGWRLLPERVGAEAMRADLESEAYVAELQIGEDSSSDGIPLSDLALLADELDLNIIGMVRDGERVGAPSHWQRIGTGDVLVVEGDPKGIEAFMGKADLDFAGSEEHEGGIVGGDLVLVEAIVPDGSRIVGRSAGAVGLLRREGVTLLGVARAGQRFRQRVRSLPLRPGDVLLLIGAPERIEEVTGLLGVLPLEGGRTGLVQRRKAALAVGLFGLAIAAAVAGLASLPVALGACAAAYAALGLVGGTEVYEAVEWKVIVLLACLIPLGEALDASGGAALIAGAIVEGTAGMPVWTVLLVLMVVTMTLSDFLNNVATALVAAPVAMEIAAALGADPDPFLMGVRFGDYWRMGLPLEMLVLAVAVPTILLVWPLR